MQNTAQINKRDGNSRRKLADMENTRQSNIHLIKAPKGEDENRIEAILEEIINNNVPELMKNPISNDLTISL